MFNNLRDCMLLSVVGMCWLYYITACLLWLYLIDSRHVCICVLLSHWQTTSLHSMSVSAL